MQLQKIRTPAILIIALIAIAFFGFHAKKIVHPAVAREGKGFAVIELFTSEGCSSCPPADELVSEILNEKKPNLYILSFHVDYWNRLGWKDNFSQAIFSDRQKQYSKHLALNSIYTPQIVVNGSTQFVGSNETLLRSALSNQNQLSNLTIEALKTNNSTVHISYKISDSARLLNVALIQPEATTLVKRGENGGRKMHHVNIVRGLKTIEATANAGDLDIEIPAELREIPFAVIAYAQQKNSFKITGASQVNISEK